MKNIARPTVDTLTMYLAAVDGTSEPDLKSELLSLTGSVKVAEQSFEESIKRSEVHLLDKKDFEISLNSRRKKDPSKELSFFDEAYTYGLWRDAAEPYRMAIIDSAENGMCPLCGISDARTLDHYLPKTVFHALCVSVSNLIPCCRDCNSDKRSQLPTKYEEQSFHPYFDTPGNEVWLSANIEKTHPTTISYSVISPPSLPKKDVDRIRHTFELLQLARRYRVHASTLISEYSFHLAREFDRGGTKSVIQRISDDYEDVSSGSPNSWKSAALRALASDEWYCTIGYKLK